MKTPLHKEGSNRYWDGYLFKAAMLNERSLRDSRYCRIDVFMWPQSWRQPYLQARQTGTEGPRLWAEEKEGGGVRFRYILAHCTDSAGISTASHLEEADWYSAVVVESNLAFFHPAA